MIDIHNHGLYQVDDGATSKEEAILMLQEAYQQGVKAIVFTPHYRHQMFRYPVEDIKEHFEELKKYAKKIGIHVYLGCEYHVNSRIFEYLESGRVLPMASGDYVLMEYAYETEFEYIYEMSQKMLNHGYTPVIAHVERYHCFRKNPSLIEEIRRVGVMIQVNADSVLGLDGLGTKNCCKTLLKRELVDVIASDAHGLKKRASHMKQCKELIIKKYGHEYAKELFYSNPKKIIGK